MVSTLRTIHREARVQVPTRPGKTRRKPNMATTQRPADSGFPGSSAQSSPSKKELLGEVPSQPGQYQKALPEQVGHHLRTTARENEASHLPLCAPQPSGGRTKNAATLVVPSVGPRGGRGSTPHGSMGGLVTSVDWTTLFYLTGNRTSLSGIWYTEAGTTPKGARTWQ
jgi:hypothetical protein